ncbi:uncharacterized protein [Miscanthus floridulus]|uniref:uncharacterized protein isoform X2 n=1 Tax=Miscanthus floridulus TaxID=154761 RepID=UPI0034597031
MSGHCSTVWTRTTAGWSADGGSRRSLMRDLGTRCARGGDGVAGPAATTWPVSYGRGSWPPPSRACQYANLFREQAFASGSIPVHFHQLIHDARKWRASLLALLGICASAERHRVLRSQGLVQQIIDAILVLDIDDPPCAIAAGALLFVLASDPVRKFISSLSQWTSINNRRTLAEAYDQQVPRSRGGGGCIKGEGVARRTESCYLGCEM